MRYSVESPNVWLYPDSPVTESVAVAPLVAARGGTVAFQVLLGGLPVGGTLTVEAKAGAFPVQTFRELPVVVTHNTGVHGFVTDDWEVAKAYATRKAPFSVFDALEPIPSGGVAVERETEAVYVSLVVPRAAKPGRYALSLALGCGGEAIELPFELRVAKAALPEESLLVTNWFSLKRMAEAHGLTPYSEAHWNMARRYGRLMRRAHQNVFWITWDSLVVERDAFGRLAFDFSRVERLIRMYLGLGFTVIEGAPLFGRKSWDEVDFNVDTPDGPIPALSAEGYEYVAAFLAAWRDFLTKNGWYGLLIQHVGDEPHERCAEQYRVLSGIIRKFLPGVKLIDAVETHELNGAVDIWVPKDDYYERNRQALEAHRQRGDEIWFYTCCIPGGFYANRLLDMPLMRARMLHWGNFRYNMPGFLHWGLNHWRADQDPYSETCPWNSPTNRLPAGDTNIVYPSKDKSDVYGSMRLEAMRMGAEDYELMRMLAQTDPARALALTGECFRAFDDCDCQPDALERTREALLGAL